MNQTAEWLLALVKGMVGKPEEVFVNAKSDEMGVLFTVKVAPDDAGRVIGREGVISKSIRDLLRCVGLNNKIRASMKLDVPERPNYNHADRNN